MKQQSRLKLRNYYVWESAWDSSKARADGFNRNLKEADSSRRSKAHHDCAGKPLEKANAQNHHQHGSDAQCCRSPIECLKIFCNGAHAVKKVAGDMLHSQAKEVADLGAGDQNGNSICKPDDHRSEV